MALIWVSIIGFFLGSIPFGLLIGKYWLGIDVRSQGSGNIGTTNVMRVGGKTPGILTFALDMGKGMVAIWIAQLFLATEGGILSPADGSIVAVAAVCGHVFSVFLNFKGGKGMATLFGVLAVLNFPIGLMAGMIWVGTFLLKRISSLSALMVLGLFPFLFLFVPLFQEQAVSFFQFFLFCGLSGLLIYRHRENIVRLLNGEEKQLKPAEESNAENL